MIAPAYTPYDGSSKPFTIGLKPLDPATWIEIDADFEAYIAEKKRLYATIPEKVFVEEADTRAAQQEVLDMLVDHVAGLMPRLPSPERESVGKALNETKAAGVGEPPLKTASLIVPEDLILMRRGDNGWRLAAGSLCFPSSWSLQEKFGHALEEIHGPVPGFSRGTRNAELIHRMFDRLHQPVERMNWSLQASRVLYYPLSSAQRIDRASKRPSKFTEAHIAAQVFIRVERQTLRKLPVSGDILFTIRIYIDPLTLIEQQPERRAIATGFAQQLGEMEEAQLDYKGLTADRDRLVAALEDIAAKD
jgi:dimethylamine monooxygenase subunit A